MTQITQERVEYNVFLFEACLKPLKLARFVLKVVKFIKIHRKILKF
jgi:hypothetical protein